VVHERRQISGGGEGITSGRIISISCGIGYLFWGADLSSVPVVRSRRLLGQRHICRSCAPYRSELIARLHARAAVVRIDGEVVHVFSDKNFCLCIPVEIPENGLGGFFGEASCA